MLGNGTNVGFSADKHNIPALGIRDESSALNHKPLKEKSNNAQMQLIVDPFRVYTLRLQ
jgi:hypothetical protein